MLLERKAKMWINKTHTLAVVEAPYNARLIDAIRDLPERKYFPDKKLWAVPVAHEQALREVIRPIYQIEGEEENAVQWKTIRLRVKFDQNKRHGNRKAVLVDGTDLINPDYGNLIEYSSDFDILERSGGFTEGNERSAYWTVEYLLTLKVREGARIEAMSGTYEEVEA